MTCRILPILALLALLVAPFGMIGGGAAAMPLAGSDVAMAHCEDMAPTGAHHGQDQKGSADCAIACAAIPAITAASPCETLPIAAVPAHLPLAWLVGTTPEADPPPPRIS